MNKKILGIVMCLALSLTMVSAVSVDYNGWDKKTNTFSYTKVLENECSPISITITDHKDNVVGEYSSGGICYICYGGSCEYLASTGTYDINKVFNLLPRNQIKGMGNLRYEVSKTYGSQEVLTSGRLK